MATLERQLIYTDQGNEHCQVPMVTATQQHADVPPPVDKDGSVPVTRLPQEHLVRTVQKTVEDPPGALLWYAAESACNEAAARAHGADNARDSRVAPVAAHR